jgi:DNA topoisomerase-3
MGVKLIGVIENELLKSVELTGQWEKQLKDIESGEYKAGLFINNMKRMVYDLVKDVRSSPSGPRISASEQPTKNPAKNTAKQAPTELDGMICPKCKEGKLLKGKTGYGCNRWKDGCSLLIPLVFHEKKIPQKQLIRLYEKGSTTLLKGFVVNQEKVSAKALFDEAFTLQLEIKREVSKSQIVPDPLPCPKCGKGSILKGKTAFGCNRWQEGCDYTFPFNLVREKANGREMTKMLVWEILKG